jgi:hypothetical protein
MTEADLEILQDPDHPEGGHVILLFRGVDTVPDDPRFTIEAVDGMAPAKWPEGPREPVAVRTTAAGLEIIAGPDIGNEIPPGVPVSVSVPSAGLTAERLWPSIIPMVELRAAARVGRPARPPRVVAAPVVRKAPVAPLRPPVPKEEPRLAPDSVRPADKDQSADKQQAEGDAQTKREQAKAEQDRKAADARRLRVALAAAAGFLLGIGSVLTYAAFGGPFPWGHDRPEVATTPSPISLYDLLAVAPTSPLGTRAQNLSADLLNNQLRDQLGGRTLPKNRAEAAYWLKQVVAKGLTQSQVDALTTLGKLHIDDGRNATSTESARLLWEIAAARDGCKALINLGYLAETDTSKSTGERREDALRWYGRAKAARCKDADERMRQLGR